MSLVQWLWAVQAVEWTQSQCCRSASDDVDMMEVMVGARVESVDRARSVLDGEVGCMPLWPWQSHLGCRQTTDGADDERRCETFFPE